MTAVGVVGQAGVTCLDTALVPMTVASESRPAANAITIDRAGGIPGL